MKKAIAQWEEQQRVVDSLKAGARSKPKVQKNANAVHLPQIPVKHRMTPGSQGLPLNIYAQRIEVVEAEHGCIARLLGMHCQMGPM